MDSNAETPLTFASIYRAPQPPRKEPGELETQYLRHSDMMTDACQLSIALEQAVRYTNEDLQMPPKGEKLSDAQVASR